MGADKLRRRKAKNARDLARRKARRSPYAKVLIVCEGEKTEPFYFNSLKDHYRLNSANVEICGDCGSDPLSILNHAKQRYREEKDAGDPFNRVYCVFDKDAHTNYQETIDKINQTSPKETFFAITSVPCFEYWLLLHYTYTTKPYDGLPGNSSCNLLVAELKNYIPDYKKGKIDIFSLLVDKLDFAKQNAVKSLQAAEAEYTDNPSTHIHKLVEFLQHIKEPK